MVHRFVTRLENIQESYYSKKEELDLEINNNGTKFYSKNNQLHNPYGPAIETTNGYKEWWLYGKCHRENGPAIEHCDGTKEWYFQGMLHRKNNPAVESINGDKEWYVYGYRHRVNGPAVKFINGYEEYRLFGKLLTKNEFIKLLDKYKKQKLTDSVILGNKNYKLN